MKKRLISLALTLAFCLGLAVPALATEDSGPSPWAEQAVFSAVELGVVPVGWEPELWQQEVTRAEFAELAIYFLSVQYGHGAGTGYSIETFIEWYLNTRPGPDGLPFQKTDYLTEEEQALPRAWFSWQGILGNSVHVFDDLQEYDVMVTMAYLLGIVKGRGGGHYDPDGTITRQEAATIMARTYQIYGELEPKDGFAVSFTDAEQIAPWALDSVTAMQSWGVLQGDETGAFLPNAPCTREQAVTAFMRLYENMPISRFNGTLAPLLSQEEVERWCLSGGPESYSVTFRAETEICTVLCVTYGGVMHPPEPSIFLIYPNSTFKRLYSPGGTPRDCRLAEQDTKFLFADDNQNQYVLNLQTGSWITTGTQSADAAMDTI